MLAAALSTPCRARANGQDRSHGSQISWPKRTERGRWPDRFLLLFSQYGAESELIPWFWKMPYGAMARGGGLQRELTVLAA